MNSGRGDPGDRAEHRVQQQRQRSARHAFGERRECAGTSKAGCEPKNSRPMKVAVPVASATGRKVRTLTSGIISSMANITPPIGVLKVAAMPAPAPAATRVMRCAGRHADELAEGRAERRADLDDRSFAPDRGAAADRERRGERLHHGDDRPDHARPCSRSRPSPRARRGPCASGAKLLTRKVTTERADHRHQDDQRPPGARRREQVGVVGEGRWPRNSTLWIRPIRARKATAPKPVTTPTTRASPQIDHRPSGRGSLLSGNAGGLGGNVVPGHRIGHHGSIVYHRLTSSDCWSGRHLDQAWGAAVRASAYAQL